MHEQSKAATSQKKWKSLHLAVITVLPLDQLGKEVAIDPKNLNFKPWFMKENYATIMVIYHRLI